MKTKKTRYFSVLALSVGVGLLTGCQNPPTAPPETQTPSTQTAVNDIPTPAPAASPVPQTGDTPATENTVTLFHVVSNDEGDHLEPKVMTLSDDAKTREEKFRAAVALMTQGDDAPLPRGTEVKELTFEGDDATVSLSREYKENFPGGDTPEANAVNAILGTLGEMGAKRVQILVEGEKIDALGGNIGLETPLPVPQELLKKGNKRAAR